MLLYNIFNRLKILPVISLIYKGDGANNERKASQQVISARL
jgi:hypothetical protein